MLGVATAAACMLSKSASLVSKSLSACRGLSSVCRSSDDCGLLARCCSVNWVINYDEIELYLYHNIMSLHKIFVQQKNCFIFV